MSLINIYTHYIYIYIYVDIYSDHKFGSRFADRYWTTQNYRLEPKPFRYGYQLFNFQINLCIEYDNIYIQRTSMGVRGISNQPIEQDISLVNTLSITI